MDAAELDVALEELETRLERLRALYEQYFMGIEKIEPSIARKDVDRRIYVLRREKIRNTAKRFKLQTIIQRYNTFQQYWQRICREIENGTYKRHLLKAQRKGDLLTIAARKRLGRLSSVPPPASQPPAPASEPPAAASEPPSAPPIAAVPAAPAVPSPIPAMAPPPAPATPPGRPLGSPPLPKRPPLPGRPDVGAGLAPPAPAPAPAPPAAAPAPAARVAAPAPVAVAKPAAPKFESLDLDMDFMGDWDPGAARKPAAPAAPAKASPAAAPPKPAPAAAPPPKPVAPAAAPVGRAAPPAAPSPLATAPAARPASIPPAPVAAPPRPASSRPPTAPAARPPVARVPAAAQRPPVERPPAPKPAPAPAAAPAPKPAPAAASASGGVDDARLRDLHSKLQQAKQQTKEANVSYEGLAKSIRATEAKLREQHKNRKIDFDVVIKDGRAIVKPIVR
jgi:hypothetical protein